MSQEISRRSFLTQAGLAAGGVGVAGASDSRTVNSATQTGKLPQTRLGRTGRLVSRIGFGGGSRYFQWIPQEKDAEKIIRYAIQLGIT